MNKRYFSRPRGWWDEWPNEPRPQTTSMAVFEAERIPLRTGLVDVRGNDLYAMSENDPVGFVRFVEPDA